MKQKSSLSLALREKITHRNAHVGVIGLGYVGLPLAVGFAEAGFRVTGIDLDGARVTRLNAGKNYIPDVDSSLLKRLVKKGALRGTADFAVLPKLDAISICVPTPLRKTRDPDIS